MRFARTQIFAPPGQICLSAPDPWTSRQHMSVQSEPNYDSIYGKTVSWGGGGENHIAIIYRSFSLKAEDNLLPVCSKYS